MEVWCLCRQWASSLVDTSLLLEKDLFGFWLKRRVDKTVVHPELWIPRADILWCGLSRMLHGTITIRTSLALWAMTSSSSSGIPGNAVSQIPHLCLVHPANSIPGLNTQIVCCGQHRPAEPGIPVSRARKLLYCSDLELCDHTVVRQVCQAGCM